jgi:hypothetical protein
MSLTTLLFSLKQTHSKMISKLKSLKRSPNPLVTRVKVLKNLNSKSLNLFKWRRSKSTYR